MLNDHLEPMPEFILSGKNPSLLVMPGYTAFVHLLTNNHVRQSVFKNAPAFLQFEHKFRSRVDSDVCVVSLGVEITPFGKSFSAHISHLPAINSVTCLAMVPSETVPTPPLSYYTHRIYRSLVV